MAMQWHLRAQNRAHRQLKFSMGRCITISTFCVFMFLLYLRIGVDRRTIESPNLASAIIQASEEVKSTPIPTPIEETRTSISESTPVATETRDTSASAEAADMGATAANYQRAENCDGRRIFIYEMPVKFNEELARNCDNWSAWWSMCEDITNFGFGVHLQLPESDPLVSILQPPSAWYRTEQFTLEVTVHERLKLHPCLTTDPDEASLFYIPFYHVLDLIRTLYDKNDIPARDRLGAQFVEWLRNQAPWQRHHGHRHVLVLGRIYWDFIRGVGKDTTWGSNLLTLPELGNVTKLLIERSPWKPDTVGIPYPTSFHPASEVDVRAWQQTVRTSNRHQFAAVAGGTRTVKLTGSIRDEVFYQCANSTKCKQVICTHELCVTKPQTVIQMGLESVFCLQPPGDSPTRKGIFDSLQTGCIPVLFHEHQAVEQYLFHLPGNGLKYSVVIPQDDVALNHYDVMDHLSRIPQAKIKQLQENIIQILPKLLYRNPVLTGMYTSKDAVDVTIDGLFERFRLHSEGDHLTS